MKRIRSLFLALCASLVAMSGLHAQYIIGSVVGADEAADGMEVVFEGRSDNSNKGGVSRVTRCPRKSYGFYASSTA